MPAIGGRRPSKRGMMPPNPRKSQPPASRKQAKGPRIQMYGGKGGSSTLGSSAR